mmetsp:Transcript_1417/g.2985  ORF Transcript_1417/g.2985 Transcript_1417/m.2985 type:complete len:739 (+) Transcript_1417:101-2317(+)|eukprot:CAMPEP_0172319004 /NCGR_PEP_ID=MMETSP1058-20130122/36464_1 /TAXON_ID=83371 /ORGANISM="Detonula confervacea, Strain CCMP 353" /LENGTH=738 /DNA_ID=CAMNT_0013033943 /DNA_START=13 /DNA_END=2229 /DNA_ORIENTATION=+
MRRKNTSKSAALTASANARAAVVGADDKHHHDKEEKQPPLGQRIRTLLAVLITFLAIRKFVTTLNQGLPIPSDFTGELANLHLPDINNLTSSLSSSTDMLHSAFDDFYATNVQPLVDMGLRSFNGTNHEIGEKSRVGYQLREQNARAKHPVVMIPGFVTTALELWEGTSCAKKHFRQRLWGSASMAKTFFSDRQCWRKHLALNPKTGMDPENIRLRAAQGFEGADNFIATYWVWSKMIENLADVGYDGTTMSMMTYDWRLGYEYLEKRDGYFTRLKHTIEAHHATSGEKVVMISHSMGGTVAYYFLQWVVADVKIGGGGGGKKWVEKHVHAFVNIAGTLLGAPKAIPALLSGELKDTATMFPQLGELLERYFGRRWRKNLWTSWGSLYGMLPKGGDEIWGVGADLFHDEDSSEHDAELNGTSHALLTKSSLVPAIIWNNGTEEICPSSSSRVERTEENTTPTTEAQMNDEGFTRSDLKIPPHRTWSMKETMEYLLQNGGSSSSIYAHHAKEGWKKRASSKDKRKHWADPIATPLPRAPSLNIYCLYGTGLPTERSYYYKVACDKLEGASNIDEDEACPDQNATKCTNVTILDDITAEEEEPPEAPFLIDTATKDDSRNVQSGIRFSDGDATVPLVSLGYMCQKWSQPKNPHNPSGIKVYTRERKHEAHSSLSDPGRGGPSSGEHVDILGNVGAIEDVVRIATGFEVESVNEDIIVSDLKKIVQIIDEHDLGGSNGAIR